MSAAERMRRMRALRRARGLKATVTWADPQQESRKALPAVRLHQARTLALHVMIAEKINRDLSLLDIVYRSFRRWQDKSRAVPGDALRMWRAALRLPWPQIAALLTEQSERGVKLRSTAPFFGILSARERERIFAAFRTHP